MTEEGSGLAELSGDPVELKAVPGFGFLLGRTLTAPLSTCIACPWVAASAAVDAKREGLLPRTNRSSPAFGRATERIVDRCSQRVD